MCWLFGNFWKPEPPGALRVHTHQQSQVESNPVQSDSQRRGSHSMAYLQWPPRQCVHTSRVEWSRVESSRVTWVLPISHESCWFHTSLVEFTRFLPSSHESCRVHTSLADFTRVLLSSHESCRVHTSLAESTVLLSRVPFSSDSSDRVWQAAILRKKYMWKCLFS
jgi:hypothetical protein